MTSPSPLPVFWLSVEGACDRTDVGLGVGYMRQPTTFHIFVGRRACLSR